MTKLARSRRPRRRPRDIMSDSEDSDEASRKFDYSGWVASYTSQAGDAQAIPVSWYPDFRRIESIRVAGLELARAGLPCVASSTFEAWTPRWVGEGLGAQAKADLIKRRSGDIVGGGLARLLANVSTYWLAHCAAGQISIVHVLAHLLSLVRLAEERTVEYAYRYSLALHTRMSDDIRAGRAFPLGLILSDIDQSTVDRMDIAAARRAAHSRQSALPARAAGGTPTPPERAPTARADTVHSPRKAPVCFDHDPLNGRLCPAGAGCVKEHLDTRQDAEAKRFRLAKASFDKWTARRATSSAGRKPPVQAAS